MKRTIQKIQKRVSKLCQEYINPEVLYKNRITRRLLGERDIEIAAYRHFGLRLAADFDGVCREISSNHRAMVIRRGQWSNKYFNTACLSNTLSLILYALFNGYVPIININRGDDDYFHWDWFFRQPAEIVCPKGLDDFSLTDCKVDTISFNEGWIFSNDRDENFIVWSFLYKTFVLLNDEARRYIKDEEINMNISYADTLGVLARGTDYISLKPKWHPVQPDLPELIKKAEEYMKTFGLHKIYLATEEERIYLCFADYFGKDCILVNKRTYYDSRYIEGELIGKVHFDRPNDNYWKSIEYLSSLIILSKCHELCAGNCGGTKFALLRSDSYKSPYVFNYGYYS